MTNLSAVTSHSVASVPKFGAFDRPVHAPVSRTPILGLTGFEKVFVPHGTTLLSQGARTDDVFYILSGWALEEELDAEGDVAWANIIMRGDVAALNCFTLESDRKEQRQIATAAISAVTDVFTVKVPRSKICRNLEEGSVFSTMVHDMLLHKANQLHAHMVALSAKCANDRVMLMLRSLYDRALRAQALNSTRRLPLSQVILARIANISVVHMNRIAQKLRQDGFLDWSTEGVLLYS
jgi:CRP-like cAMP-binding protein